MCTKNLDNFFVIRIASLSDGLLVSLAATISDVCVTSVDVPSTWEGFSEVGHDIAGFSLSCVGDFVQIQREPQS